MVHVVAMYMYLYMYILWSFGGAYLYDSIHNTHICIIIHVPPVHVAFNSNISKLQLPAYLYVCVCMCYGSVLHLRNHVINVPIYVWSMLPNLSLGLRLGLY